MIKSLIAEIKSRNKKICKPEIPILENLEGLTSTAAAISDFSARVNAIYKQFTNVPLNMEILASKLEVEGAPLSIVANNYEKMVNDIHHKISEFLQLNTKISVNIGKSQFQVAAAFLQKEMISYFEKENDVGPIDPVIELKYLRGLYRDGLDEAIGILANAESILGEFQSSCEELKHISLGLEIVRITGKIEAAKIIDKNIDLTHLLDELNKFKSSLKSAINELVFLSNSMLKKAETISSILHENNRILTRQ